MVSLSGSGPLHQQIYGAVRESIVSGRFRPGMRLPPTRELAAQLGVSRNVVVIAYENLAAEGYVLSQVGVGTSVAKDLPDCELWSRGDVFPGDRLPLPSHTLSAYAERALTFCREEEEPASPLPYDFSCYRTNEEDFPVKAWRRLLSREANALPAGTASAQDDPALRREFAAHLRRTRGVICESDQVLSVNGSQQALDLVARVLLDAGDSVAMEEPHYAGAREIFQSLGARIAAVPVDEHGLAVDRLPPPESGVRLVYVTPSHQFPTGAVLSLERRLALLSWAEAAGAYILEDDSDGDYCYDAKPLAALQGLDRAGRVLYTGTFSRLLAASLRIGYLVVPRQFRTPFAIVKRLTDRHTSPLPQQAIASFLSDGHFDRHLRRSKVRNASRRNTLLAALRCCFEGFGQILGESTGTHIFIRFPCIPVECAEAIARAAAVKGVRIEPATGCYFDRAPCAEFLIGYNGVREPDIAPAIRLLRSVFEELR